MAQTNHGSIEFLRFPDPAHPGDRTRLIKKWLRDSWGRRKIVDLIDKVTSKVYTPTGGWTWGNSFDTSASTCYCRRMHNVVQVTFTAKVSAAINAATDRNIVTNLPAAMTRVYGHAYMVTFSGTTPSTITPVMTAIRPEETAVNSNKIIKVDAATNPTTIPVGGIIYGTIVYISNDF